jgi:hypothetical protein
VSFAPRHRALGPHAHEASSEPALEVEQYWDLLHDLMNQLTTTRLYTQRLLARLQNGDPPSETEWRDGVVCIDRAALVAVGLIKTSLGAPVVKLPYVTGGRSRTLGRRAR